MQDEAVMDEQEVGRKIATICQVWIERANPDKIILFGSAARGQTTRGSDLDFLVVWRGEDFPGNRRRAAYLRQALVGKVRAAIDILVLTPEQFAIASADPWTFTSTIVNEGRLLYERVA